MTYAEKLKDPRWQKKRLEILDRDGWKCRECDAKGDELHVHHRSYHPGMDPWDYSDQELITFCKTCHAVRTSLDERLGYLLGKVDSRIMAMFVRLLERFQKEEDESKKQIHGCPNVELLVEFFIHSSSSTWDSYHGPEYISDAVDLLRAKLDAIGAAQMQMEEKI